MSMSLGKPSDNVCSFIKSTKTVWKWTAVRDCPEKFIEVLNSYKAPQLYFIPSSHVRPPWKGFWGMNEIKYDNWSFQMQLEYGHGDETSIMLTFEGRQPDSHTPKIIPVVVATKIEVETTEQ